MKIIELEDHNYTEKAEGFRGFDGKKLIEYVFNQKNTYLNQKLNFFKQARKL